MRQILYFISSVCVTVLCLSGEIVTLADINISMASDLVRSSNERNGKSVSQLSSSAHTDRAGGRYQFLHFSLCRVCSQRPEDLTNLGDLEGMKYEMFER